MKWNWIKIDNKFLPSKDTFPPEGIEVLISDGENYDVAYYLRSGEYKWIKVKVKDDDIEDFLQFVPTMWCKIQKG